MSQSYKYLTVVRHAKSSWDFPELADHDRPLGDRGLHDAPRMAVHYAENIDSPDRVISSTARRAKDTAAYFIDALNLPDHQVSYTRDLFHAGTRSILLVLSELSDRYEHVMIFGHNPGFTDFVNSMTDEYIDNMPTCGVAVIRLKIASWKEIKTGVGRLEEYFYPKALKGRNRF